jgi:hypothetical protein
MWQLFAMVPTPRYVTAVALFLVIGLVFLVARLPDGVREVQSTIDLAGRPLTRSQRVNLSLVILASQGLQITLVAALVWLFFSTFGALLVDVSVVEGWTTTTPDELFSIGWLGGGTDDRVVVTAQLLRASLGIAAFSGLYYTVAMLVDATYRDEFVHELTGQMRTTFAVRTEYLRLRGAAPSPNPGQDRGPNPDPGPKPDPEASGPQVPV